MDLLQELDGLYDDHFGGGFRAGENTESNMFYDYESDIEFLSEDEESGVEEVLSHRIQNYQVASGNETFETDNLPEQQHTSDEDTSSSDNILSCKYQNNCLAKYTNEFISGHVFKLRELLKDEKELIVMSNLKASGVGPTTKRGERKRKRYNYKFEDDSVCRTAFQILFDVSERTLLNIIAHVNKQGITPRKHGLTGRTPSHALKFAEIEFAVTFIRNLSDEIGIPQPAAPSGRDSIPPTYLPASETKVSIHKRYKISCEEKETRALGLSSFKDVWCKCVPEIKISTPRTDVCHICERMRKQIMDAVTEEEKLAALQNFQKHIEDAGKERQLYRKCVQAAINEQQDFEETEDKDNYQHEYVHYTFDFAQQVSVPHHSRQMGPLYFVSARIIQVFGVRVDGLGQQYNYLIDENQTIGADGKSTHGPNAVLSMLDHALSVRNIGEKMFSIHADNCSGQNKNRFVVAYFAWRVLTGLNDEITYMMQVPGHARCLVDSGFASLKKLYRRSDVDSLDQLADIVEQSSTSNHPVLFGIDQWQWRDWKTFFNTYFTAIKHIRKYQIFRFCRHHPGKVFTKERTGGAEVEHSILKTARDIPPRERPPVLQPAGMSHERPKYLYKNVRQYVRPAFQDRTCPAPAEE